MRRLRRILASLFKQEENDFFLGIADQIEDFFAKILTLGMLGVVLFAVIDLGVILVKALIAPPETGFSLMLLQVFGLFLNVLIALEIAQNITSYLATHIIQIEMVLATALIAVARKIIILDFEKVTAPQLLALAVAIIALGICYWLVRRTNNKYPLH